MSRLTDNTGKLTVHIKVLGETSNMTSKTVNECVKAIQDMSARMAEIDSEVSAIESLKQSHNL